MSTCRRSGMASSASNYDVAVGVRPGADGHDDSDKGKDGRKAGPAEEQAEDAKSGVACVELLDA